MKLESDDYNDNQVKEVPGSPTSSMSSSTPKRNEEDKDITTSDSKTRESWQKVKKFATKVRESMYHSAPCSPIDKDLQDKPVLDHQPYVFEGSRT